MKTRVSWKFEEKPMDYWLIGTGEHTDGPYPNNEESGKFGWLKRYGRG